MILKNRVKYDMELNKFKDGLNRQDFDIHEYCLVLDCSYFEKSQIIIFSNVLNRFLIIYFGFLHHVVKFLTSSPYHISSFTHKLIKAASSAYLNNLLISVVTQSIEDE